MNRLLLLLLLHIFLASSAKSQDYIKAMTYSFADSTTYFELKWFQNNKTRLYGYKKGDKIIIPAEFDFTNGFSEKGIARVTLNSPYSDGDITSITMGTYNWTSMAVGNDGLNGFIDTLGNIVIPIKYSVLGALEIYNVVPYSMHVELNGEKTQKYGLINDKGEEVLDAKYDFITKQGKTFLASIYKEDDEEDYFYLDDTGRELGRDGLFDKFVIISDRYPKLFYVENNGAAYLIDQNFVSNADPYLLNGEDEKNVQKKLLDRYLDDQNVLMQEIKDELNRVKYSPNIK